MKSFPHALEYFVPCRFFGAIVAPVRFVLLAALAAGLVSLGCLHLQTEVIGQPPNGVEPSPSVDAAVPAPLSNDLPSQVVETEVLKPPLLATAEQSPPPVKPPGLPQLTPPSDLDPGQVVAAQERVLNDIYHASLPSVVSIRVARNMADAFDSVDPRLIPDLPEDFFQFSGGSGFVWDDEGHIVTNHHVVAGADRVTVILSDRTELDAEVLGTDPDSDLAVMRVEDTDGLLRTVSLGDSDLVNVGQLAAAVGNPFGQQFSITSGIVSGVGRTIRSDHSPFSIPEVIQTDAPINPGNSGGPLLDRKGQVIGVNTLIISRTGVNSGIGFAVPINIAKQVIPALVEDEEFHYSWLGISGASLRADVAEAMGLPRDTRGALVIEVVPQGPADEAGLQGSDQTQMLEGIEFPVGGDVVVSVDGQPVKGIDDVIAYLVAKTRPDQEITLEVIRNGERQEIVVTLGTRPGTL